MTTQIIDSVMTKEEMVESILSGDIFGRWYNEGDWVSAQGYGSDWGYINFSYVCSESIALELVADGLVIVEYDEVDDHYTYLKLIQPNA